jgi:hypothetical protein
MTPEQNLWVSVVAQMFQDACKEIKKKPVKTRKDGCKVHDVREPYILAARSWLNNNSDDFKLTCHLAGLEPDFVSRKWKEILENNNSRKYWNVKPFYTVN